MRIHDDEGIGMNWKISGGGGTLSTAADYARFCQMLLNGGELDGIRILSPKTVVVMTSDELPPGIARIGLEDLAPTQEMGQGFGLGFAVRTDAGHSPLPGSVGDYLGAGAFGTYFRVVPKGEAACGDDGANTFCGIGLL